MQAAGKGADMKNRLPWVCGLPWGLGIYPQWRRF